MLHGYKKSRYNIYDNLEFLGLNPYEQKHFCFGEDGGDGAGSADDYEETTGFKDDPDPSIDPQDPGDTLSTDSPGLTAEEAEQATAVADATGFAVGSPGYQAALDAAAADVGGYSLESFPDSLTGPKASTDELDALEKAGIIGYNQKAALGYLDTLQQEQRASEEAAARALEQQYGLERGQVTPAFMTDPTGVQTASFRGPGAVGAVVNEVARGAANLGLNLVQMAPTVGNIGMQIARDQGLFGLDKKSLAEQAQDKVNQAFDQRAATMRADNLAARGITEPETLTEQVTAKNQQEELMGMFSPEKGDPSLEQFELMGMFSPEKGDPSLANLYAAPTNIIDDFEEEQSVGGMFYDAPTVEDEFDYDYLGADDGTVTKTKKQVKTTPVVEEVDVAQATPVAFPNIDTTPPSRISRIARIYNISEDAAKRMLGVA